MQPPAPEPRPDGADEDVLPAATPDLAPPPASQAETADAAAQPAAAQAAAASSQPDVADAPAPAPAAVLPPAEATPAPATEAAAAEAPTTGPAPAPATEVSASQAPSPATAMGAAPGASAPASPPPSARRRWARRLGVAAGLALLALLLGPWLLSATVLTAAVRTVLARGDQPGGLGRAELSWSSGLRLDRVLVPSHREGVGPRVLLDGLSVELPLARAVVAAATGGTVPVRVVVGRGRIELDLPADADAGDDDSTPAPAPEPDAEQGEAMTLPCAVAAELVVEGLDISLSIGGAPGAAPMRLSVRGLKVDGGAAVERTTAVALPRGFHASIDELRLEAPELLEGPLVIEGGALELERLAVTAPTGQGLPLERVSLAARLVAPRADAEGSPLRDLTLDLSLERGELSVGVAMVTQGGTIELRTRAAPTDPRRIPLRIALQLDDVHLSGRLARALPYLVPILQATTAPTRTGPVVGLPPVSIKGAGAFDLVTSADGTPLLDETLRTLSGGGDFSVAPGSFTASRAIDGYARGLLGLSVSSYLDGLLPPGLKFDGASGAFQVAGGEVVLPAIDLRAPSLHLRLQGKAGFDGRYGLNVRAVEAGGGPAVAKVLQIIDQAGGVSLEGDLGADTCTPTLPDPARLEAALRGAGLPDLPLRLPGRGRD